MSSFGCGGIVRPMRAGGQDPGHLDWAALLEALVAEHGTLSAVAERLARERGHAEDLESIARGLRRLRARGHAPGGQWGERLLRTFGPGADVEARLRFMGAYHSRFVDLPVPLCADLVQLWDRPPTSESRAGRLWLPLARAILALRDRHLGRAAALLQVAERAGGEAAGRCEVALGRAYVLAGQDLAAAAEQALAPVESWLSEVEPDEAACLRARLHGQRAWLCNRRGEVEAGEALHRALPDGPEVPAYALSRRATGLAYARWRQGDAAGAAALARQAARHAGDAGHVRLRAMALLMLARVLPDEPEGRQARQRAAGIGRLLGDATILARVRASEGAARDPVPDPVPAVIL